MYVLAFALRGIPWAIDAADKPEFRAMIRRAIENKQIAGHEESIAELERRIAEHRAEINRLAEPHT
jgi:hypothetical protein